MAREAVLIVHWPGQSMPACEEHADKLKNLAAFMGFPVTSTPANGEMCKNCENESHLRAS